MEQEETTTATSPNHSPRTSNQSSYANPVPLMCDPAVPTTTNTSTTTTNSATTEMQIIDEPKGSNSTPKANCDVEETRKEEAKSGDDDEGMVVVADEADRGELFSGQMFLNAEGVEGLYCKRPIQCLASSEISTSHPITGRRVCSVYGGYTGTHYSTHSPGGGHTCWMERGWGVHSSEDARHCSVLYICKYFVAEGQS
jgi:hypothetical protein